MVGHCNNQIPQQPEKEQQSLSLRWREIHYLYALPWGWSSKLKPVSEQKVTQKWCPNSCQPRPVWQKCLLTSSPEIKGVIVPLQLGCLNHSLLQRPPKSVTWLISLSFGTPLNEKPICYSIHSIPESLTFSSSAACQIKIMSLLTPGNFSAHFWPELP